ncbi:hotdog fold thioesterase [Glutamicibacter arilaitensis]|uniref:hotdog fold thioesterase n=1 Tax=Glutamicibacter arilaitensis TaxID=256701 RepID=UPI00384F2F8D
MAITSSATPASEPWTIELGALDRKMGVEILEESVQKVVARMPVEGNTQSFGILHGGASLAVGEAVGSWAAVKYASTFGKVVVGVDVNATHHRSASAGMIFVTATPIKLGRRMTSHEVVISDERERRICTMRITNLVIDKPMP